MIFAEVTPEVTDLLQREANEIITELYQEQPDIDRDEAVEVGAQRLTDRVVLYQEIERAVR